MTTNNLEGLVGDLLRQNGLWLATAESCTGGLIASRITDIPGSSDYFLGGVVAYANRIKISQLGVSPTTLDELGAVSREIVLQMALGARERFGADLGLAVSGIAGPGGGTARETGRLDLDRVERRSIQRRRVGLPGGLVVSLAGQPAAGEIANRRAGAAAAL